jgi:hypothetical protein
MLKINTNHCHNRLFNNKIKELFTIILLPYQSISAIYLHLNSYQINSIIGFNTDLIT